MNSIDRSRSLWTVYTAINFLSGENATPNDETSLLAITCPFSTSHVRIVLSSEHEMTCLLVGRKVTEMIAASFSLNGPAANSPVPESQMLIVPSREPETMCLSLCDQAMWLTGTPFPTNGPARICVDDTSRTLMVESLEHEARRRPSCDNAMKVIPFRRPLKETPGKHSLTSQIRSDVSADPETTRLPSGKKTIAVTAYK